MKTASQARTVPSARIDTVGLPCPLPIARASEAMAPLERGAVLEVISDDGLIAVDLKAWCDANRHEYLGSKGGEPGPRRLWIRKGWDVP